MSYVYQHVGVDRVIDGDTVGLTIDMGNAIRWTEHFRLNGIDTPERGQPGYSEAKGFLEELLATTPLVRVETFKPDKYGRWLADLYVGADAGGAMQVNRLMILQGHAKEYLGGRKG